MEFVKKKLENINIVFISSLPLALAAGPAIIEFFTAIIIINFLILKKSFHFHKTESIIFAFYIILVASSSFSEFKLHSLDSSVFLIRIILLYYVFKHYLKHNLKKILNLTLTILFATLTILIIDTFFQYFNDYSIFGTERLSRNRVVMHFRDEAIMGGYFSKVIPIFLGIWLVFLKEFSFRKNILFILLLFLSVLSMLLTNERSASFFLFGFLFLTLFFSNIKNHYKILSILALASLLIFTLLKVPNLKHRYIDSTIMEIFGNNDDKIINNLNLLRDNNESEKPKDINEKKSVINILPILEKIINNKNIRPKDLSGEYIEVKKDQKLFIFSTAHEAHIRTAFNMFLDNIFLGVGPNNFRNLCSPKRYGIYSERGCSTHPHHILSQIFSETGLIGFIFYLTALIYVIFKLFRQFFKKDLNYNIITMLSFYLMLLLPIMPSGNIFSNWYLYSITLPFLYLRFSK